MLSKRSFTLLVAKRNNTIFRICLNNLCDGLWLLNKSKLKNLTSALQSWQKIMPKTAKNGVVLDTTSNVQPI